MQKMIAKTAQLTLLFGLFFVLTSACASEAISDSTDYEFTRDERAQAIQWGLDKDEYLQFKTLLQSPRAYITPKLEKNPLLALGVMATTAKERQKYADKWVRIQYENNVKTLVWVLEVDAAWDRNYPGIPRFAYGQVAMQKYSARSLQNKDYLDHLKRKKIWLNIDGCEECVLKLSDLLGQIKSKSITGIDIFINDLKPTQQNNRRLAEWAMRNNIGPKIVQAKIVTINYAGRNDIQVRKSVPYIE